MGAKITGTIYRCSKRYTAVENSERFRDDGKERIFSMRSDRISFSERKTGFQRLTQYYL